MTKRQPCIYKITNIVNGKVYIGQTVNSYERRIQVHFTKLEKRYHNNIHLQRAFDKYGKENFIPSVVTTCTVDEIDEIEKYWIKHYKEMNMSYNIEEGGNYIKELAKETKEKLTALTKASWQNKEIRNKRIKNLKRGKENFNSRSIICITDNKIFVSMTEASEYYSIDMKAIFSAIKRKHYCKSDRGKLEFDYYVEGKDYKPKNFVSRHSVKVICLTTGEIFDSAKNAAKAYNLEGTNISKVCRGKRSSTGKLPDGTKLKWAYYEEHLSN